MLLWVTVAQMAIPLIVTFSRLSPDDNSSFRPAVFGVLLHLARLVPGIAAGSNWARVAAVLFAAFSVLFDATSFPALLSPGGPMATLDLVGDATLAAADYLILVGTGATWFNRHRR
jgi:hypothetical protein